VSEARPPGGGRIDPAEYQARLDRIGELLASMIDRVGELSTQRCPYKNRFDQCTAQFGCRNQRRPRNPGEPRVCAGDDRLDYRSAWETA
jgi:hypothetical protein